VTFIQCESCFFLTCISGTSLLKGDALPFEVQPVSADSDSELELSSLDGNSSDDSSISHSSTGENDLGEHLRHIKGAVDAISRKSKASLPEPILPITSSDREGKIKFTTELMQVKVAIKDIVTSLYKISMVIRRPLPSDRHVRSTQINVQYFAEYDRRYVCDKFPTAEPEMIDRLSRGVTRRRQILKYRKLHNESIQASITTTAPAMLSDIRLKGLSKAPSSHIATSTKATTFVPPTDMVVEEVQSLADTESSYHSASSEQEVINIPPRPRGPDGEELEEFECPYCYIICEIKSSKAWR